MGNIKLLSATQVGGIIGVNSYTLKKWYKFYENLTEDELAELESQGMPKLPHYAVGGGNRGDRFWNEADIEQLKKFKEWSPHTKNGIFKKYMKKE